MNFRKEIEEHEGHPIDENWIANEKHIDTENFLCCSFDLETFHFFDRRDIFSKLLPMDGFRLCPIPEEDEDAVAQEEPMPPHLLEVPTIAGVDRDRFGREVRDGRGRLSLVWEAGSVGKTGLVGMPPPAAGGWEGEWMEGDECMMDKITGHHDLMLGGEQHEGFAETSLGSLRGAGGGPPQRGGGTAPHGLRTSLSSLGPSSLGGGYQVSDVTTYDAHDHGSDGRDDATDMIMAVPSGGSASSLGSAVERGTTNSSHGNTGSTSRGGSSSSTGARGIPPRNGGGAGVPPRNPPARSGISRRSGGGNTEAPKWRF